MSTLTLHRSRVIHAPVRRVWEIVADLEGYHRHTGTLAATTVISGAGLGARRHCVDRSGNEWQETCTHWQPEDRYVVEVDVSTYPPRYRALFRTFTGSWRVGPVGCRTRAGHRFEVEVDDLFVARTRKPLATRL